jgi:hypothetical protein
MFCNSLQYREKPNLIINLFIYSSALLLLTTSAAKFISASGHAGILKMGNPILGMPFRGVLWIAGSLELIVALMCFLCKQQKLKIWLITWLSTSFLMYRIGSLLMYDTKFCPCLGNLTDALHVNPQAADNAMKIVLVYLLFGSYAALFWLRRRKQHVRPVPPSSDSPVSAA